MTATVPINLMGNQFLQKRPSPQHEQILAIHRDLEWHCSTEYEFIRDHRKRISELNAGYLKDLGYQLVGRRCDGRCGKNHSSTLFMRRAEPLARVIVPEDFGKRQLQLSEAL